MAIALDGSLADWQASQRLDTSSTGVSGYALYATLQGDKYIFALQAPVPVGPETTFWINVDRNDATGHQAFAGAKTGAEFYINFFSDGKPYLYSGNNFGALLKGPLDVAVGPGGTAVEFSVLASDIGGSLSGFDLKIDVNNATSLPNDYDLYKYVFQTGVGHVDATVFGSFAVSPSSVGAQIYALYDGLLGRSPDLLGLEGWADKLQHGTAIRDIAQSFLNSTEGQARFGAVDDASFIEQMYQGNLHRGAAPAEIQGWLDIMKNGATRTDVALGFSLSQEHLNNLKSVFDAGIFVPDKDAADVARLYYSVLDRAPDVVGLQAWTHLVEQGTSLNAMASALLASDEYEVHTTGLTDKQFVQSMYQQILGRAGEDAGVQYWSDAVGQGTSRATVSNAFTDSFEFQSKFGTDNTTYVQSVYHAVLGRDGDSAGVAYWTTALDNQSLTRTDMAHIFTGSPEFKEKYIIPSDTSFVSHLYEDALGRSVDAPSLKGWTDALAAGASRADVAVAISTSVEAQQNWVSNIEQGWHLA